MKKKILVNTSLILAAIIPTSIIAISCKDELSQAQIEKETIVDANVKNSWIKDFTKDDFRITVPKGYEIKSAEVTAKDEVNNHATIKITIVNLKTKKEYVVWKTVTGFVNIRDIEAEKMEIKEKVKLSVKNIDTLDINELTLDKIIVENKISGWTYVVESFKIWSSQVANVIIKASKNDVKYEFKFEKEIIGFKKDTEIKEKIKEITIRDIPKERYANHWVNEIKKENIILTFENDKLDPKNYEISTIENVKLGIIFINLTNKTTHEKLTPGTKITGFKKFEWSKNDAKITIEGLDESQYKDKTGFEVAASKDKFSVSSISGDFEYEISSLNVQKRGKQITVYLKITTKDGKFTTEESTQLTGFKEEMLPEDKDDIIIKVKGKAKEEFGTISFKDIDKNHTNKDIIVTSKSGKYKYRLSKIGWSNNSKKLTLTIFQQYPDGDQIATFNIDIEGFAD
ncbi:hypothetical protein [Metamycoplasma equirhinis]|uniref:hypothetical protein n=1 Tax=Metamycoplasma equirhinis TaxID=92402 RepID=UPI003594502D